MANGYNNIDFLSNGFKIRDSLTMAAINAAGVKYIYAFAENHKEGSNTSPANAR